MVPSIIAISDALGQSSIRLVIWKQANEGNDFPTLEIGPNLLAPGRKTALTREKEMSELHPSAGLTYDRGGLSEGAGSVGFGEEARVALAPHLEGALAAVRGRCESGDLGFASCVDEDVAETLAWVDALPPGRFRHVVVIGIGGSSLGTRAVLHTWSEVPTRTIDFWENVDPMTVARRLDAICWTETLFVVVTKSGSTIETMSQFWIVYQRLIEQVGESQAAEQIVAITDPERGSLRELSTRLGFRTFDVPPNVGGRFSVLTSVGVVPLALVGYPVEELLAGAREARDLMWTPPSRNPLLQNAADHYLLYRSGVDHTVMFAYADQLELLVDWFCQLWAESLGKRLVADPSVSVGITPIKVLGPMDQHSQVQLFMEGPADKHITFLEVQNFGRDVEVPALPGMPAGLAHLCGSSLGQILQAELRGTQEALARAKRPTSTWSFSRVDPHSVGGFLFSWQAITAFTGALMGVEAFDQPGVELGKSIAHKLLGRADLDRNMTEDPTFTLASEPFRIC
jgi:glucose-6-phosphate isomerase